jgi:hypothetical protein
MRQSNQWSVAVEAYIVRNEGTPLSLLEIPFSQRESLSSLGLHPDQVCCAIDEAYEVGMADLGSEGVLTYSELVEANVRACEVLHIPTPTEEDDRLSDALECNKDFGAWHDYHNDGGVDPSQDHTDENVPF